jgi:hypothetical protein
VFLTNVMLLLSQVLRTVLINMSLLKDSPPHKISYSTLIGTVLRLAKGWTAEGRSSSPGRVQTGSGDHPASYTMGIGSKAAGA